VSLGSNLLGRPELAEQLRCRGLAVSNGELQRRPSVLGASGRGHRYTAPAWHTHPPRPFWISNADAEGANLIRHPTKRFMEPKPRTTSFTRASESKEETHCLISRDTHDSKTGLCY
jgi:hypothetical protein